jgi:catechol 2,3-dioxygenase-like lactoylglutathione lyase family enzyme
MSDERPVLNQLNLVARDFDASLAFYRRLGLDLDVRARPDFRHRHAEIVLANGFVLELDDEPLARLYNAGWRRAGGGSRALIGFSVPTREAVDRRYAELLAAGYAGRQRPYDTFWGARYAVVADPDGNEVGLMSPLDERRRSWPPVPSPDP